jgi:hypothetical protein
MNLRPNSYARKRLPRHFLQPVFDTKRLAGELFPPDFGRNSPGLTIPALALPWRLELNMPTRPKVEDGLRRAERPNADDAAVPPAESPWQAEERN